MRRMHRDTGSVTGRSAKIHYNSQNILDPSSQRLGVGVYVRIHPQYGYQDEEVYATQNFSGCE